MNIRFPALLRPLAILAGAGIVAALMLGSRPEPVARSLDQPLPSVQVQTVRKTSVPISIIAHGTVRAWRELTLTAEVTGRVLWAWEGLEPGVVVKEDQLLLRVDPTDYELALAEARQALASAELSLADAQSLRQKARIEEAEATVAAARARIARARRDLDNTEIRAPYNAVVDSVQVESGQFISVGTQVARLLGSDRAEIRLPVIRDDALLIEQDESAPVTLSSDSGSRGSSWQGSVSRIEARVDSETRVVPVVVDVPRPLDTQRHGSPLPFGLFVRAEIQGRAVADAVEIPQAALHGDNAVFLFADGRLARQPVTVMRMHKGMALITEGLEDGDRVVTTRLELMFEGMQIALADD